MSSDDIQIENSEAMQTDTDETNKDEEQISTSQQALKQLNQLTANYSNPTKVNMAQSSASTATTSAGNTITKSAAASAGGKIVYIKSPNGTPQQIRIGGSLINASTNSANSGATTPNSSIQLIKANDKLQFVKIQNKNVAVAKAGTSAVTAPSSNTRLVLQSGGTPTIILKGPKTSQAGGTTTRPITMTQAHQMGLITDAKYQEYLNKTNATAANATSVAKSTLILPASSAGSAVAIKNPPTILNKGVKPLQSPKILIQSSAANTSTDATSDNGDGRPKQIANKFVKVASRPNIRAVNVPGKGVQYVQILNTVSSNSGNTATTTTKVVNGRQQQVIVQRKIVPQQQGAQIASNAANKQFVTKKLEVMPIGSNANRIIKKEGATVVKAPATYLLNNVQKNVVASSIDVKPVASNQNDSFEITSEVKVESPASSPKKFTPRTYSMSGERKSKSPEPNQSNLLYSSLKLPSPEPIEGIRRKHCNCTKSQCLKLYCDCFANGEFCSNCNCKECFNTLEKEDERQKAIKICLERNPHAFKPKIGKARDQSDTLRRHTKGCNCKRSGCLKNYCECYEAKIVCSANCKCIGCRNIDDHMDTNDRDDSQYDNNQSLKRTYEQRDEKIKSEPIVPPKKPCNFITPDVIEATVQCIIAQADDCMKKNCDAKNSERKILEEFGRCLVEIIDFSKKNNEADD